jgi:hypothetical protein
MGLYSKEPVKAGAVILPLAIEAASRANGDRKLSIYKFAAHVNHCWSAVPALTWPLALLSPHLD